MYNDKLNNKNLWSEFHCVIQTNTAELLTFPERKESLTNDWAEENGKEYDLKTPKFHDKEATLKCLFIAENETQFWEGYNAFFAEWQKSGWQNLYIDDHSKTYECFYKKTENFVKLTKRIKNVSKIIVNFEIVLVVRS